MKKKGGNKMSDAVKKRMKELKEKEKMTDFQHTQLLCLNTIMDSLVSIAQSLKTINYGLSEIFRRKGISKEGKSDILFMEKDKKEED